MIICSIIVPLFNAARHLENLFKTLDFYFDNNNYEIIFVDDSSIDDTKSLVISFIKKKYPSNLIFLQNNKNYGPSYTRNIAIRKAKGKFISFLDSDDSWHLKKMDIQIKSMLEYKIAFSGTKHSILPNKEIIANFNQSPVVKISKISFIKSLFKSPFATPSVIIERNLINKYLFDNDLRYGEDYDLWLRILRFNKAIKINNKLTFTFKHDYISTENSLSSNLYEMHKSNLYTFKKLFFNERKLYLRIIIILAYFFEFIKYYRRKIIKLYFKNI